ncbi:MAG: DUF4405 domain-containing protein [Bacteroidota bacterium]|nr:DUF4405 domain-containing protein [Bacteroidota bacterium]
MESKTKKKFQWRSFTTFYIVISFLIISISGIILYITPPGRVANWSDWKFIGLTKYQWQSVHTIFTFLFVVGASFHIYFNWKVLITYLRTKLHEGMKRKRELMLSSTLAGLILVFTIVDIPPFKTVMDFGEEIANSWVSPKEEPPIPHAELLTLADLTAKLQMELPAVINRLQERNIIPDSQTIQVRDLADKYDMTAKELFGIISPQKPKPLIAEGMGFGRKTISQICEQYDVSIEDGMRRLKEKSIEASFDDNLRDLADKYRMTPIDIVKIIVPDEM